MKSKRPLVSSLLIGSLLLSACSPNAEKGHVTSQLSVGVVANSNLPPKEKAEELAKQAEELMTAQGFKEASRVVDLALAEDPQNIRAGFIKALLGPILLMKGLQVRVRPLYEYSPKALAAYEQSLQKFKEGETDSAMKEFMLDGKPDIRNEEDLQKELDKVVQAFEKMRLFIKSIKNSEMTFKVTTLMVPNINDRYAMACQIKETANLEYELVCPPSEDRFNVTLNQADFGNLQDAAAGYALFATLYSAYDLTGARKMAETLEKRNDMTQQEVIDSLLKGPRFAKLRPESSLKKIKEWGLDYAAGLRWSMNNQSSLCPQGVTNGKNRPGMLMNQGICVGSYYQPYIDAMESILKGEIQKVDSERDGITHNTTATPMALFDTPIQDFRQLGGMKFDRCGQLQSVGEGTLGGVFPQGDANKVLSLRVGCSK